MGFAIGMGVGLNYGAPMGTPLILDVLPTAPAFAVSMWKLRTAYAGACLRVRRSTDNAEQDIGFASTGLIDTSALLAFCGAGSGFVARWYDQSTNANNAQQTTAAMQWRIVNAGVLENVSGLPAVTNWFGTEQMASVSTIARAAQNATINAVIMEAKASMRTFRMVGLAEFIRFSDGLTYPGMGRTVRSSGASAGVPGSGKLVYTHINDASSHKIYTNGTLGGSIAFAGSAQNNSEAASFGEASSATAGLMLSEALAFTSSLSTADRNALERSQGARFGITVA
jgi:hypothetical protein